MSSGQKRCLRAFAREYFEDHENERTEAVVALYERERITLGDAGRLTDIDRWTIRDIFHEHGIELRVGLVDEDDTASEGEAAGELEFSNGIQMMRSRVRNDR